MPNEVRASNVDYTKVRTPLYTNQDVANQLMYTYSHGKYIDQKVAKLQKKSAEHQKAAAQSNKEAAQSRQRSAQMEKEINQSRQRRAQIGKEAYPKEAVESRAKMCKEEFEKIKAEIAKKDWDLKAKCFSEEPKQDRQEPQKLSLLCRAVFYMQDTVAHLFQWIRSLFQKSTKP